VSAIIHRTIHVERRIIRCVSHQHLVATSVKGQRSSGARDSPVPPKTGNQPITRFSTHALFTVRCAPDSPVHRRTEGNQSLPNGGPTAPRSLGAIKGTPRCMKHYTKHLLNILQRRDFAITPLFHWDRYLSASLSYDSALLFHVLFSWLVCVLLLQLKFFCVFLLPLTIVFIWDHLCKAWETPNCGDSSQQDIIEIKREPWYSSWSLDHLKGVECNPRPLGRHNVE
jgi:hypothetical protein